MPRDFGYDYGKVSTPEANVKLLYMYFQGNAIRVPSTLFSRYNPIELTFSAIKAKIRHEGKKFQVAMTDDDNLDVYLLLNEAIWSVTAENARGWFGHCGYSINDTE